MYMYTCVYMYIYIYMYVYIYIKLLVYMQVHAYVVYINTCVYLYIYVYIYTCIHIFIYMYMYIFCSSNCLLLLPLSLLPLANYRVLPRYAIQPSSAESCLHGILCGWAIEFQTAPVSHSTQAATSCTSLCRPQDSKSSDPCCFPGGLYLETSMYFIFDIYSLTPNKKIGHNQKGTT